MSSSNCYTVRTLVGYGIIITASLTIFNILGLA